MNLLSHGVYTLDARDPGLNIRLKSPCLRFLSTGFSSGAFSRFSLAGRSFDSPDGAFTFFGVTMLYLDFKFSFTPRIIVTLLIFFWIGDAEPRARGNMRFNIGPPSARIVWTK